MTATCRVTHPHGILIEQPTGGVSTGLGSRPSSTASRAPGKKAAFCVGSSWSASGAPPGSGAPRWHRARTHRASSSRLGPGDALQFVTQVGDALELSTLNSNPHRLGRVARIALGIVGIDRQHPNAAVAAHRARRPGPVSAISGRRGDGRRGTSVRPAPRRVAERPRHRCEWLATRRNAPALPLAAS